MSDYEWNYEWDLEYDESSSPPPTPGKNLIFESLHKEPPISFLMATENIMNFKRRLDLEDQKSSKKPKLDRISEISEPVDLHQGAVDLPKKYSSKRRDGTRQEGQQKQAALNRPERSVDLNNNQRLKGDTQKRIDFTEDKPQTEGHTKEPLSGGKPPSLDGYKIPKKSDLGRDKPRSGGDSKNHTKDKPRSERSTSRESKSSSNSSSSSESKKLKVAAWANILKFKKKLYIPWQSDPRIHHEDQMSPISGINLLANTPVKIDYDEIMRNIILPKLVSPLHDFPVK